MSFRPAQALSLAAVPLGKRARNLPFHLLLVAGRSITESRYRLAVSGMVMGAGIWIARLAVFG